MKFKSYLRKCLNKIRKFFSIKRNVVITSLVAILIIVSASIFMNFEIIASRVNTVIHDIKMSSVNVDGFELTTLFIDEDGNEYNSLYEFNSNTYGEQKYLTYQINYKKTDASKSYTAGDLEIVVDNLLNNTYLYSYQLSADKCNSSNKNYTWSFSNDKTYCRPETYQKSSKIYLTNNNDIEANTNFEGSIRIKYELQSGSIVNNSIVPIKSILNNQVESNEIDFKYTSSNFNLSISTTDKKITSLDGLTNANDYTWVAVDLINTRDSGVNDIVRSGNYKHYYKVNVPDDTVIVSLDNSYTYDDEIKGYYAKDYYFTSSLRYKKNGLLYIGYPKSKYSNSNVYYEIELYGVYSVRGINNEPGENPEYQLISSIRKDINTSDFEFIYSGDLYHISKKLNDNRNVLDEDFLYKGGKYDIDFDTIYTGSKYNIKIGDDLLLKKNEDGVVTKLLDDEYSFKRIDITTAQNGNNITIPDDKYDVDLFVRYRGTNEYVKYGDTFKFKMKTIDLSEKNIVGFYVIIYNLEESFLKKSNDGMIMTELDLSPSSLKAGDYIYNFAYLEIYNEGSSTPVNIPDDYSYLSLDSKTYIKDFDNSTYGHNMQRSYVQKKVNKTEPGLGINISSHYIESINNNSIFKFFVNYMPQKISGEEALFGYKKEFKGYELYGLLPELFYVNEDEISNDLTIKMNSELKNIKKSNGYEFQSLDEYKNFLKNHTTIKVINNWKNTNKTMIKIIVDYSDDPLDLTSSYINLDTSFPENFYFYTYLDGDVLSEFNGNFKYDVYIKPFNYKWTNAYSSHYNFGQKASDILDVNENGDKNEYLYYNSSTSVLSLISESNQDLTNFVKSDRNNYNSHDANVSLNNQYTYKLRARNANNKITNLVIYDSIENYIKRNDEYVLARGSSSNSFKGTFKGVDTSYAESKGYKVKVYYSESEKPGSLKSDTSWKEYNETTTNKSKVKSLAFEYLDSNGNKAILPDNSLTYVEIIMNAPAAVEEDKITTYNGSWVEWNALDSSDNVVPDVIGINSNIVSVNLPLTLKVRHLIKDSDTSLLDDEIYEKNLGDAYTTNISTNIPSDYIYDSTSGDATNGTITKSNTEVIYYYRKKEPILSSTINKTGTDTIGSRKEKVNYKIEYMATVKDLVGTANITIVDKLPYEIDTSKEYNLDGGTYNASNKTITWNKTISATTVDEVSDNFEFNISFSYKNIPVSVTNITNKVTGKIESLTKSDIKEKTITTNITEKYKLIVHHYYKGTTNAISPDVITYYDGGAIYNTNPASVQANYDVITPENSSGVIENEETVVTYYYEKKNSKLNSIISKTGTNEINSFDEKVSYIITYNSAISDYIGNVTITVVDKLPYEIDTSKEYNLDGGTYNASNKTITWNKTINKTNIASENQNLTYNVSYTYKDVNHREKGLKNNVIGKTILDNNNLEKITSYTTKINIKGKIIVKYIDVETNEELINQVESEDNIYTNKFVPEAHEIDHYDIIESPSEDSYEYEEETKTLYYKYKKRRRKVITKVSGNGGTIQGDEEVVEGQDSTKDNIIIKADDNFAISKITINGQSLEIEEGLTKYTVDYFKNMQEDKVVVVEFVKKEQHSNPPTGSFISIITISFLLIGGLLLFKYYKNKSLFNRL